MKHLLNNLSIEEKNRIREQYEGGMSVDTSKFKKLLESRLGNVKPLIMEREPNVQVNKDGTPTKPTPKTPTSVPKTPTPPKTNIPQPPKSAGKEDQPQPIKVTLWGNPDGTDEKENIDVDPNSLKLLNTNVQFEFKFAGSSLTSRGYFDCSTPNTVSVDDGGKMVTYYLGQTRVPHFESKCARNQGYASVGNQNTNNQV